MVDEEHGRPLIPIADVGAGREFNAWRFAELELKGFDAWNGSRWYRSDPLAWFASSCAGVRHDVR